MRIAMVLLCTLVGCGGDDGGSTPLDAGPDAAIVDTLPIDTQSVAFALTSPTITEGGTIPLTHVCTDRGGMNLSPALAWSGAPAGTLSFAIVFTDKSGANNGFLHGAIYDVPAALASLPADVDKQYAPADVAGAHQTKSWQPAVQGWNGPCPGQPHTYELKIYATSVAALSNGTINTTTQNLLDALPSITLGTATLTATFTP